MIDENMVCKDISFAEMGQPGLHYAMDPLSYEHDPDRAVALLFKSAGYQKRSCIHNIIPLIQALGEMLIYPKKSSGRSACLFHSGCLKSWPRQSHCGRVQGLGHTLDQGRTGRATLLCEAGGRPEGRTKTTFQIPGPQGNAKCTASNSRQEIRLPRDFSTVDRRQLKAAVTALLDQIG
ncbi:hypothetical protein ACFOM8_22075 [Paracoccus angustae]|uniref:Uncharacterized protein n=1 Tax=Paracoccus angustae TaxID=1671480 RepID=A0ABV7UAC6_9RHOB